MNRRGRICIDAAVILMMATVLFAFWRFVHIEYINYHEEYQLLLLNTDYFAEHLRYPGGIAAWVAKFLTQFFIIASAGATVLALLLIILLLQVRHRVKITALALIPLAVMLTAMGDENLMPAYLVSIIMAMAIEAALPQTRNWGVNVALTVVASVLSYWITGPMAWLTMLLTIFHRNSSDTLSRRITTGGIAALALVAITFVSCKTSAFPAERIITGLYYYRNPIETIGIVALSVPIAIFALSVLYDWMLGKGVVEHLKNRKWLLPTASVAVVVLSIIFVPKGYAPESCDHMRYDYYVRAQLWDDIIEEADRKKPTDPFCICALNLALAKRGELCDRMFDYTQNYNLGLLPPLELDHSTPLASAEVFWHMGLINSAQQYCFEAMEAIPDYQKSGRIIKRLAQTNIVNGQYDVARKYLHILQQTLLYRFWANKEMARINKDAEEREMSIISDPVYGHLRMMLLDEDVFFRDANADIMFGKLFLKNKSNSLAKQYLIAYPLVMKDLKTFYTYMGVVQTYSDYMPLAAQEALSIIMPQQVRAIRGSYFNYLNSK